LWIGNSHTYSVPGTNQGEPVRTQVGPVGVDVLANSARVPGSTYWLLAYPNFLPGEMFLCATRILIANRPPRVVVLGLTWSNLGREQGIRSSIAELLTEPDFTAAVERALANPKLMVSPEIRSELDRERQKLAAAAERDRVLSLADSLDRDLMQSAGKNLTLIGQSDNLRARFIRDIWLRVVDVMMRVRDQPYAYDMNRENYERNYAYLSSLLRLLHEHGVTVVCYLTPANPSVRPILPAETETAFLKRFQVLVDELNIKLIDTRTILPAECWGWDINIPDRLHFTLAGHKLLGELLSQELARANIWPPTKPSSKICPATTP